MPPRKVVARTNFKISRRQKKKVRGLEKERKREILKHAKEQDTRKRRVKMLVWAGIMREGA